MQLGDLYKYTVNKREEQRIEATISINGKHPLYGGHFPGSPITPGVCQLLMIREILEAERKVPLLMYAARQIKFTAVHEPEAEPEIDATVSFIQRGDRLAVAASLHKNNKVFLKFKGEFKEHK